MPKNHYSHITSAQLAKICNVSQGTVDRALNGREGISTATKAKILEAARVYGYTPNIPNGSVKGSHSMLFGIVLLNLYNDYFSRFVMDFENLCKRIGYNSIVMFSHNNIQTEIGCINQLVHLGVDGIIISPVGKEEEYCSYLQSLGTPVVTIANRLPGIPFVGLDDFGAMKDLTEHAIRKGYRNLVYYAPVLKKRQKENIYAQERRYEGFLAGVQHPGVTHTLITESEIPREIYGNDELAFLCPSDVYATRVLNDISEKKLTDVGLFDFDNCELLSRRNLNIDSISYDPNQLVEKIYSALTETDPPQIITIPHGIVSK